MLELLWYQVILVFYSMEQWQAKLLAENKPDELQGLLQELQSDMTSQLNDLNTLFIEQIGELNASYSLFPIVVYFDEIIQTTLSIEFISYWQQNFQKQYFQTDIGGDLFYERLEEILAKRNIDIFVYSVFYFCLNDGFKGRYVNNPQKIEDDKKQIAALVPAVEVQPDNDSPPTELRTLEQINFASYIWNALLIVLCIYVVYYFFHGN